MTPKKIYTICEMHCKTPHNVETILLQSIYYQRSKYECTLTVCISSIAAVTAETSYGNAEQKPGTKRTGKEDMSSAEFTDLYTFIRRLTNICN